MRKNVNLQDIVEANQLLMSMGAQDQLPVIASNAIERYLELQSRVDRAIQYAEEAHSSSLHAKQMLRILDGSITIDDHNNEVRPEPQPLLSGFPQPALRGQISVGDDGRIVERKPLPAPSPKHSTTSPLADRNTDERKAFRTWLEEQGRAIPYNKPVPPELVAEFDEATNGMYKPKPRQPRAASKSPKGKLKPGHGLAGRSESERAHLRTWLTEQGFDLNPSGRIPQRYIEHYDAAMRELARMQRDQRQREQQREQEQEQHQEREQHAQSA